MILLLNSPPKFTETMFLDTVVYKGTRLNEKVILDVINRLRKPCSTHFADCHPPICQKSLRKVFQNSKERLMVFMDRGYQHNLKDKLQSEINETHRNRSPGSWNKTEQGRKRNVAFRDTIGNLRTTTTVHDDHVCCLGKDWNGNVSFGRKKET